MRTFLLFMAVLFMSSTQAESIDVWIGTGNVTESRGIYHCELNTDNGKLTQPKLAAEISGPGFLSLHPGGKVLYAVGSLDKTDVVAAYTVNDGTLTLIDREPIGDGGATHVSVDPTGRVLLTAQYGGGSVASFKLNDDGSIAGRASLVNHEGGSGVVAGRQNSSHAHWTGFSPDNRFAFVPDLGLDKVMIYAIDHDTAELTPHGHAKVPAGGGPRHMKFHTSGKWAFVLNELSLSITVFDYDAESGKMTPMQTVPTVAKQLLAKEQFKSASEIRVHPSGQFVYSANRGHDTISVFRVNQSSGELSPIEIENARSVTPRGFNLDPSGRWLVAAGQDSHTLVSFVVNQGTGELQYNRSLVFVPAPICVLFVAED